MDLQFEVCQALGHQVLVVCTLPLPVPDTFAARAVPVVLRLDALSVHDVSGSWRVAGCDCVLGVLRGLSPIVLFRAWFSKCADMLRMRR